MTTAVPKNTRPTSFRINPEVWDKARDRAKSEGVRVSVMVADLVEGYALGHYDLPQRRFPSKVGKPETAGK